MSCVRAPPTEACVVREGVELACVVREGVELACVVGEGVELACTQTCHAPHLLVSRWHPGEAD